MQTKNASAVRLSKLKFCACPAEGSKVLVMPAVERQAASGSNIGMLQWDEGVHPALLLPNALPLTALHSSAAAWLAHSVSHACTPVCQSTVPLPVIHRATYGVLMLCCF